MAKFSVYVYDGDTGELVDSICSSADRYVALATKMAVAGYHIKVLDGSNDVVYMLDACQ